MMPRLASPLASLCIASSNKYMAVTMFQWCDYNKILLYMKFTKCHNIRFVENVENVKMWIFKLCVSSNFHAILNFQIIFWDLNIRTMQAVSFYWCVKSLQYTMDIEYWILNSILVKFSIVHNIWMKTVNTEHWTVTINPRGQFQIEFQTKIAEINFVKRLKIELN